MDNGIYMNDSFIAYERGTLPETVLYEDSSGVQETRLTAFALERGEMTLTETITPETAQHFNMLLRYLASKKMNVKVFISSPGGEFTSGMAMIDAVRDYPYEIDLYCSGLAASMAAILLASGKKGHRFILPNSTVMIHEPVIAGSCGCSVSSVVKTANAVLEARARANKLLSEYTGRPLEEINKAASYDHYYDAGSAIEFGLCDRIASGY